MTLMRMCRIICSGAIQGVLIVAIAGAQSDVPRFADPARRAKLASSFAAVDTLFIDFVARNRVPGAAWGIVIDGELAHASATGLREIASNGAVETDTVFRIASMTKSFTAMAILKLRDEGKLALDDAAERYVPELASLKYPTSDSPKITIRHLLSHAEGFPEDNPWGDQQLSRSDEQLSRMLRGGIPFSNAPGVAYEYSNYGFAILGRIVTNVSRMPYEQYVTANILKPLGMTSTTFEPATVPVGRLAHGYRSEDEVWKEEPQLPHGSFGAMGGLLTTVRDLSKYVAVFLSAWPPRDGPETAAIRRSSLREMQQLWRSGDSVVVRDATGTVQLSSGGYGFGLRVSQTCTFRHVVAHSGGLPGFGSIMQWLPDYGVGIIALGNRTYTGWGVVTSQALDLLAKTGGLQPRTVQPSRALVEARDAVSKLVIRWDDELADRIAAENLFLDLSKDRRRRSAEALLAQVGACTIPSDFDEVENALRGSWTMSCERGKLNIAVTLAPTMPPTVQFVSVVQSALPRAAACQP